MALVLGPLQNLLDKSSIDSRRMATLGPSAVSRSGVDALIALLGGKGLGTWTWHSWRGAFQTGPVAVVVC